MAPTAPIGTPTDQETWDEKIARLRGRQPRQATVTIFDEDAQQALAKARISLAATRASARARLDDADQEVTDEAVAADPEVRDAEQALQAAADHELNLRIVWRLRALPPDVYDTFSLDHPPTEKQQALQMQYDPTTYHPALIAACSVDPISADTIAEMIASAAINQGDLALLVQGCRDVNQKPSGSLGKG